LEVNGRDHALASLEGIGRARHLNSLHLSGGSTELDLSPLHDALPDLEILSIHLSLSEVRGLGGLPNLRCLSLKGIDQEPTSLAELGSLPRLEELFLTSFHSLDGLQNAPGLRILQWEVPPEGAPLDCAALAHLPNLQEVTVLSCEFEPERHRAAKELVQRITKLCPQAKVELQG